MIRNWFVAIQSALFMRMAILIPMVWVTIFGDWTQIGLAGKEITSIAVGKTFSDTLVIAGTRTDGIWYRAGRSDKFTVLESPGVQTPSSFLIGTRCLYFPPSTIRLFAGGDSGLSYFLFSSGLVPQWRRVSSIPQGSPVTDITGRGDTLFCATSIDVYRSYDGGLTWAACSTRTFLPPRSLTSYTSVAIYNGVCAGSKFWGPLDAWQGVIHSGDYGKKWRDVSNPASGQNHVGSVHDLLAISLSSNSPQYLLAAVDGGIKSISGTLDTGTWQRFAGFTNARPNALFATYSTRMLNAEIFAASDSGLYVLWPVMSFWTRITVKPVYCIGAYPTVDTRSWYVGTADGVWEYTRAMGVITPKTVKPAASAVAKKSRSVLLNGRRVPAGSASAGMRVGGRDLRRNTKGEGSVSIR